MIALKMNGFDTPGSFRFIKSDDEFNEMIKKINGTLKKIYDEDYNKKLKEQIIQSLDKNHLQFIKDFSLPFGHELLLKSIINYSQKQSEQIIIMSDIIDPAQSTSKTAKKVKNELQITEKAVSLAQKYLDKCCIEDPIVRPLDAKPEGSEWIILCCYCRKDVKVFLSNGINISNYKAHVNKIHINKNADQSLSSSSKETLINDETSGSSSTTNSSPPAKRMVVEKDDEDKIKKDLSTKVKNI